MPDFISVRNYSLGVLQGILLLLLQSCTGTDSSTPADSPGHGSISISVDKDFKPLIDSQQYAYTQLNPKATIQIKYGSESDAILQLLLDSVRVAIVTRELRPEEKKTFEARKITPRTTKIATDAIAMITNPDNKDTLLTYEQVKDLFSGKIKTWKEINPKSNVGNIQLIFNDQGSGIVRYFQDSVIKSQQLPSNSFATGSNESVIEYVEKNKGAIGFLAINWVSDSDDSMAIGFLKRVNILQITPSLESGLEQDYYKPYQAWIGKGLYPFRRQLFAISREARVGLGTGFISFMAGDKGQRIVLKSGLMPATRAVRQVQIIEKDLLKGE